MKKTLPLLFLFISAYAFSQTSGSKTGSDKGGLNNYKDFFRFDAGYEDNEFMAHNGWRTHALSVEFEKSFNTTPFARNYRVSLGLNDSSQFYMHLPAGPIAGVLLFIFANSQQNYCTGIAASTLLFILPDGFAFNPVQNDRMQFGIYANFLGVDYCNSQRRNAKGNLMQWDYAPDFGARFNYYIDKKFYVFSRLSAKYSSIFAGWGAQATVGIGFEFEKS